MRVFLYLILAISAVKAEDFYEFLGIEKQATDREIRQAFKKKALVVHPDKNPKDPDAHENFLKLNRIYEVLKDQKLRKKYDDYGEEGLEEKSHGHSYHSWSYYKENFGIYDDDHPEIITLSQTDFDQISESSIWFINYYHPMCSHCHTLAPVWRDLAKKLYGVVRFGAVNCDDSSHLCNTQNLRGFPTLMLYPKGVKYTGRHTYEDLLGFVMDHLDQEPDFELTKSNWKQSMSECKGKTWLVIDRGDKDMIEFIYYRAQLKSIFKNLLCLGELDCDEDEKLCTKLKFPSQPKFYQNSEALDNATGVEVGGADTQEFAKNVLSLLPGIPVLTLQEYSDIRESLREDTDAKPLLVLFTAENEVDFEMRKLPALLSTVTVKQIFCSDMKTQCDELFVSKTPSFVLFKKGGSYELHQGRTLAHDIATFAEEAVLASHFQTFTPKEFTDALSDSSPLMVDFFAPWCPPCMKLLPEFKRASRLLEFDMKFGSVDCTVHSQLCSEFNIRHYPTTILYNQSTPHEYRGHHSATHIADFVKDTLQPVVVSLDENTFQQKIREKDVHETWVVDYFANWCGPCLEMAPEYRTFARLVKDVENVHVATIDCATHKAICQQQGINSYPTIRLYPAGNVGTVGSVQFKGWNRDATSFQSWLYNSLPSVVRDLDDELFENILRSPNPWVVYFHLPQCSPCQRFAPVFEQIARDLEATVYSGKLNCQKYQWICRGAKVMQYPSLYFYKGATDRQSAVGVEVHDLDYQEALAFVRKQMRQQLAHDEL